MIRSRRKSTGSTKSPRRRAVGAPANRQKTVIPLQSGQGEHGRILITSAPRSPSQDDPNAFDILRKIRGDILSGVFAPGQRLKTDELRTRYDVSVGTLREALLHLLSEGLVRSEMNRGFSAAPVSLADLMDITNLRIQIEIQVLSDSILNGGDAWEAEIVTTLHLLQKLGTGGAAVARMAEWPERHRRFHQALVAACRSPWLLHFRSTLFDQAERYRSLGRLHRRSPRDVNAEHQLLAEAALARNVTKACDLAESHIRRTVDNILTTVPAFTRA